MAGVGRRGKNVVLELSGGAALVVNLGMTGRLLFAPAGERGTATHPGVTFRLVGGDRLVYDDVRRFGELRWLTSEEWARWSDRLGPEPLGSAFTRARLGRDLAASRSPVRSWLLDQRRVAGVGNIYANEALHLAGIHPATPARDVSPDGVGALHRALRRVLRSAIRARGTTLRDYRDALGGEGSFGPRLVVYGRDGQPCTRCGAGVERMVISNRSAFYCPSCQPPPETGPTTVRTGSHGGRGRGGRETGSGGSRGSSGR